MAGFRLKGPFTQGVGPTGPDAVLAKSRPLSVAANWVILPRRRTDGPTGRCDRLPTLEPTDAPPRARQSMAMEGTVSNQTPDPNDPLRRAGRDAEHEVHRTADEIRDEPVRTYRDAEPPRRSRGNWWWILLPLAALAALLIWALNNNDDDADVDPMPSPSLTTSTETPSPTSS